VFVGLWITVSPTAIAMTTIAVILALLPLVLPLLPVLLTLLKKIQATRFVGSSHQRDGHVTNQGINVFDELPQLRGRLRRIDFQVTTHAQC
jgi:hypothetical protein